MADGHPEGLCRTASPKGGACQGYEAVDSHCASGLTCNTGTTSPTCLPPQATNGSCGKDDDCADGLVCNQMLDPRHCTPLPGKGEKCYFKMCAEGLECTDQYCS